MPLAPRPRRVASRESRATSGLPVVAAWAVLVALVAAVVAPEVSADASAASFLSALPGALVGAAAAAASATRGQRAAAVNGPATRPGLALRSGVAGAAATLAVGGAWAFATAPVGSGSLAAALAPVPGRAGAALVVLGLAAALGWAPHPRGIARRLAGATRGAVVAAVSGALVAAAVVVPAGAAAAATEPAGPTVCTEGQQQREYAVAAATLDVPFNRWGATLRRARVFVLEQDLAATRYWSRPLAADPSMDPARNRRLRPRPLVLRANEGECVRVRLTNRMSTAAAHDLPAAPRVGIQAAGVVVDARGASGARVGFDADSTVGAGESITYYWRVPEAEGLFMFSDLATPAGGEHDGGSRGVGLYGALAVEPAGSVWTDPRSGAVLSGTEGDPRSTYAAVRDQSGELYVEADIHPPGAPAFRESVQVAQDEVPGIGMGFNYGSEPLENREESACPDCLGEETWLSSWPYGDPALVKLASGPGPWLPNSDGDRREAEDCGLPESCFVSNVFHTYSGDPTKIRFGLAGVKETHVFHLHAHQWLDDPRDSAHSGEGPGAKPESATIDSQTFGPNEAFTADLLHGAGSANGTFGDSIFHCHLYPHFAEGFWSLLRVHDVRLDGSTATPDGVGVRPLVPLEDRETLPAPTADNPGYPGMIPGTYGWRAPQPPGSVTEGGADGAPVRPAPRLVAGRDIEADKLAVEEAVSRRRNGGREAPAGAPYADPCPTGAREVDYDVTVMQRDLVYNEAGDHDPQARIMVLTKDVPDILAGRQKAEPLFVRVNAGDCVNFSLTNMTSNWTGGDAFQQLTQVNMAGAHIHLVKFDVTASDGGSNGWNYQEAAFTSEQADFTRRQASGEVTCTPGTPFFGGESTGCRIPQTDSWAAPEDSTGLWGQTIHERWYADYELRTVFTHDHHFAAMVQNHGHYGALIVEPQGFDVRDPATGDYLPPVNDAAHGTPCGTRCDGEAVGERVDVVGPGANDDFRELGVAVADFVPLVRKGGDPGNPRDVISPPPAPEYYPDDDPGTYAMNYRNAPLSQRLTRDGAPVDPAHRFSSWVFGDPMTPLLQGYARDDVRLRVIQGSQEEQHVFGVHGVRWREEPDDPGSPLVNAQTIGVSEAFNAEMPGVDCRDTDVPCRGDYLYGGTSMDDLWNGMWGIMRVHGRPAPGVRALPDNPVGGTTLTAPVPASRQAPPRVSTPGASCPSGAPVRSFDVVAIAKDVVYTASGDHDPQGLMFVLAEDEKAVVSGERPAEPLVLRANAGDCVRVALRNALPRSYGTLRAGVDGDAPMTGEHYLGTPMGTRVSLHPQLLRHDVRRSDGAAVGFNPDSTAGIGQTSTYEWYADTELGATNLLDFGDVRGHRQHGLAAALVIEPRHASYHDPVTGAPVRSGAAADIRVPGQADFRELTLIYQDGLNLRTTSGEQVPDKEIGHAGPDVGAAAEAEPDTGDYAGGGHEDAGEKAVSYASEPLHRRLGAAPGRQAAATSRAWAEVLSSAVHGDPVTPMARAYAGDQVRMRVLGGNRPRQTGFQLGGAAWRQEPYDRESPVVGVQGGIATGRAVNAHVVLPAAGDHLWSSPTTNGLPDGVWGIARVYPRPDAGAAFTPSPVGATDDPFAAGAAPLQPLERASLSVQAFVDDDGDGTRDDGEAAAPGTPVTLHSTGGERVLAATTGSDGTATLSPQPGAYDLEVDAGRGRAVVAGSPRRVDLTGDGATARVAVGLAPVPGLRTLVFVDDDADGVRDAGEAGAPGWTVEADGATGLDPVLTAADGSAAFPAATPGTWSVDVGPRAGWRTTTPVPVAATVSSSGGTAEVGVARLAGVTVRPVADPAGGPVVDGPVVEGLLVEMHPATGASLRARAGSDGAVLDPAGSTSRVRVLRPDTGLPWACTRAVVTSVAGEESATCDVDGWVQLPADATAVTVRGDLDAGVVTASLFDDADRDGRRDPGEAPLASWPVALVADGGRTEVARTTTDASGAAGLVVPPGRYTLVPQPPASPVAWKATTRAAVVDVRRGAGVGTSSGWVQPGSVSVGVFHDLDADGVREDGDPPLADRTVRLLSGSGSVLATQVTDGTGRAAFAATAGRGYRVAVSVPTPWRATGPRAEAAPTTVLTTVPVTAPADGGQASVEVGHHNTVDRTPPPAPVAVPGSPVLARAAAVTLSAETGATVRYTLDGTAPTASRGMAYTAPVRVSTDRVLRAVAVDAAGNVSSDLAVAYDLPWRGRRADVAPSAWAVTTGGAPRGGAAETAADDGRELAVAAARVGSRSVADVTASVAAPTDLRRPASTSLSVSLRTTLRATTVTVQWFEASTGRWRPATTVTQGTDEARLDVDLGPATGASAADGTVKVRVVAAHSRPFDLVVDRVAVSLVNPR